MTTRLPVKIKPIDTRYGSASGQLNTVLESGLHRPTSHAKPHWMNLEAFTYTPLFWTHSL